MSYLVGIDLGSTNLKAIVYDPAGKVVARASRPTQRFNPYPDHPQWAIWKPEQIWGGVAESLREAVAQVDDPRQIRGVAVTGMGMDGVPLDAAGRWLYPFISWHCPRTEPQYKWWLENIGAERQFAIGGNQLWVFNTALRLRWMAEHEPEILARTHKWVLIEDFINYMLCNAWATDYSMASTTLLFDQRRRGWSEDLLHISGLDQRFASLPAVASGGVWNNNLRMSPGGGNDYFESAILHPDKVLTDLVKIFHPALLADKTFTYYKKIAK